MFNINEFDLSTEGLLTKETINEKIADAKKIIVYGAGHGGAEAVAALLRFNVRPDYIVDNNPDKQNTDLFSIAVHSPDILYKEDKKTAIIITPGLEMGYEILLELSGKGFFNIFLVNNNAVFIQYLQNYRENLPKKRAVALKNNNEISVARSRLSDYLSRKFFDEHLQLWTDGIVNRHERDTDYFFKELFTTGSNEVFVDCGANKMETVEDFIKQVGGFYEKVIAFEADYFNYTISRKRLDAMKFSNVRLENTALYTGTLNSNQGGGAAKCDTLDNLLANEKPTFIRFDIKGAEQEVLESGVKIIAEARPVLAISIYHKFNHLWELPLFVSDNFMDYNIYLRKAAWNKIILLAVPYEREVSMGRGGMNLVKGGMKDLISDTENKKIILLGDSVHIPELFNVYKDLPILERVTVIADDDVQKHNKIRKINGYSIPIVSPSSFHALKEIKENFTILIMAQRNTCRDVFEGLKCIEGLPDISCWLYTLLPYYDNIALPQKITALKSKKPRIPKIIHYFWIGKKPLPDEHEKNIESWKHYNPEYEIKLWNESNYDFRKTKYMAEAYDAGLYAFATDYARLDVLYKYGGIYLDTDIEVLKSFDDLLYYEAFFGMYNHTGINTGSGFGCMPSKALIKELRDAHESGSVFGRASNGNRVLRKNVYFDDPVFEKHGFTGGNRFHIIDNAVVFPVNYFNSYDSMFGLCNVTEQTYAIHKYGNKDWVSEEGREKAKKAHNWFSGLCAEVGNV